MFSILIKIYSKVHLKHTSKLYASIVRILPYDSFSVPLSSSYLQLFFAIYSNTEKEG